MYTIVIFEDIKTWVTKRLDIMYSLMMTIFKVETFGYIII